MRLLLRAFAPSSNAAEAGEVGRRLREALAALGAEPVDAPERYWKVPEWYEHTFRLSPPVPRTFDAVVALARGGWHHTYGDAERSSVWNPAPDVAFLLPEVTWAEVLLVHDD